METDHDRLVAITDPDTNPEPGASVNTATIPDFARAWESQDAHTVRRLTTPLDPETYHVLIDTAAIFELDENQKDGSIETILVVPFSCPRCKNLKQACSRMWPVCARCKKAGLTHCDPVQQGYQRLPGPKYARPRKQNSVRETQTVSSPPAVQETTAGRPVRAMRAVPPISQPPLLKTGATVAPRSKRSLSPGSDCVPPQEKSFAQVKIPSQKRRGRPPRVRAVARTEEMDVECPATAVAGLPTQSASVEDSANGHSVPEWTFVKISHDPDQESLRGRNDVPSEPVQSNTAAPRVWTKSLDTLLTVFPELGKTAVGFSWFQFETPILLLDIDRARGHWIDSTTLTIDLMWDFSCYDFELESCVDSFPGDFTQSHSRSMECLPENRPGLDVQTMGFQHPYPPTDASLYPNVGVSAPFETTDAHNTYTEEGRGDDTTHGVPMTASTDRSSQPWPMHPPLPSPDPSSSCSHPALDGPLTPLPTSPVIFQPRLPVNKPPEVETLLNSQLHFIPLLIWAQRGSELAPSHLSPEYAYSCMGLFFISDLHHRVIRHDTSPITGLVQGRICWSVTLQWAPGGEEALFDSDPGLSSDMSLDITSLQAARDLSHPWWFDPGHASSQADNNTSHHPRDLRMQFFSYIPLDLLADFHPSESFPRGWFCKRCGMINPQLFFRHQICQSSMCRSIDKERASRGKVDSLSSLRGPCQSSTLVRPTNHIPSVVDSDSATWDDGMQSWMYTVNDGVAMCHVFTGNQEHLQEDATALLERIQCEVLLRKEDNSSPYFTHTTRLSHPSDGSEATVPTGTPDPVRIAYYSLCDLVHRYGEMENLRFGEVHMQAWVNPGSKRGAVFRASRSPVVVHCLGAEVVLSFTPKGGYKDVAKRLSTQDKGKERVGNEDQTGSRLAEPRAGSSRHPERDGSDQTLIFRPGTNKSPIAENVDESTAVMDTVRQRSSFDAGDVAASHLSTFHPGMKVGHLEAAEPKQERARKKIKVTQDKNKASGPEISMTLLHGDCVVLSGDDFECQIIRTGTTILVIGIPEEMAR